MRYPDDDDDDDSSDSWHSTNESVEHHPIDEVVDTVDTPSDVTDPDTLINEQSFSQASPVEHHPTASDEATCTTALQSTHRTDQHTTGECCYPCRQSIYLHVRCVVYFHNDSYVINECTQPLLY